MGEPKAPNLNPRNVAPPHSLPLVDQQPANSSPGATSAGPLLATDSSPTSAGGIVPASAIDLNIVIREHFRSVFRYAFRLAGNAADAEDLTQQTFLIAQSKLDQLREQEKTLGWLFTVLRNLYLKSKRKREDFLFEDLQFDANQLVQRGSEAESLELEQIDADDLQAAIAALPESYKIVVLMFFFEEASYKEIAAALNLPMGTVMSRLSRAKTFLRERLSDEAISQSAAKLKSPR